MRFGSLHTLISAREPSSWPEVHVACVWLPQLPLRVEVLRHPSWDGRPLVLGGAPGERKVVHLVSAEAERAGVRVGLPLREVLPLCPDAIVVQPDPVRVAAVLDETVAALQQVSPSVELAGEQVFLDLRGLSPVYQHDLSRFEATVRAAVPRLLRPRLGIAGGKFTASVAARQASPEEASSASLVVPAPRTRTFLASLPIAHLPFDPNTLQRLGLLGLRTIGDLARLPLSAVQAQFGSPGARAWRFAHGRDDEPLIPRRYQPSVTAALRFDDPLASVEAVMAALDQLLAGTFSNPALRGRSVRQVRLRALLSDGSSWERLYTFKEALSTREAARLALKAKLELPNGFPPAPLEEMFLELLGLGGESAKQGSLFVARPHQVGQIAEAGRQLRARYGRVPLYHAMEVEPWSRIPERRWALVVCDI